MQQNPLRDIVRQYGDGAEHVTLKDLIVGDIFIPDGGPEDPWEYGQNTYKCTSTPEQGPDGIWTCNVELIADDR